MIAKRGLSACCLKVTVNIQVSELAGKMGHKQVPDTQNWFINSSSRIKVVGRETFNT